MKNASGQALFTKKKAHEARVHAFEQGLLPLEALRDDDIFEIQHHHLLQCLERATVSYRRLQHKHPISSATDDKTTNEMCCEESLTILLSYRFLRPTQGVL